jgi:gliding motility-associated-like protein
MTITDNVGEPFTETIGLGGSIMVTQGFLQPDIVSKLGPSASIIKNDVTCSDKKDGNISIAITNTTSNFSVNYIWSPSTVCPTGNCSSLDSLNAGTYSVLIIITNTTTSTSQTLTPAPITINDLNGPCKVKIYTGVTPNGDGENDVWTIDNIDEFPANHVVIFNRWGLKVFETNGYNNTTKAWPLKGESSNLVASTYFYVLNLGNGTVLKGWIELIKN